MSIFVLPTLSAPLESIVDHFGRQGFDSASTFDWRTKFAVCLATATVAPYLILILLTAIITVVNHSALGDAIVMVVCILSCGWLFALPCVLAVLMSALFGRYFFRVLTILLPFFLFVGWDTLGLWWVWQDEESRFHHISFGDELLSWGFYAGQVLSASGINYAVCIVAVRLAIHMLVRCGAALVSLMLLRVRAREELDFLCLDGRRIISLLLPVVSVDTKKHSVTYGAKRTQK